MSSSLHPTVADVTTRIVQRSAPGRAEYLRRIREAGGRGPSRGRLACANLAHGFAASDAPAKAALRGRTKPNLAIVSAYNDMLSAHQPFETFPATLKQAVIRAGGIAQFAGGVPAMCDGITQGRDGMQALALQPRRDRDVDRDRALPRHVRRRADARRLRQDRAGAAHRRAVVRAPPDGLRPGRADGLRAPNGEKARIRQLYAEGKVGRAELLEAEAGVVPLRRHHVLRHRELQPRC